MERRTGPKKNFLNGPDIFEISKLVRNLTIYTFENKIRRLIKERKRTIDSKESITLSDLKDIFDIARTETLSDNIIKRNE